MKRIDYDQNKGQIWIKKKILQRNKSIFRDFYCIDPIIF